MDRFARARTQLLHAGWDGDPASGSVAVPIHQTTAFGFESADDAAQRFAHAKPGHIYSRISNPTVSAFEARMAALEGGVAAVAFASGQAATLAAILALARGGDEIVASSHLYGGTWTLFADTLASLGITTRFADPGNPDAFVQASGPRTRAWFGETIANPLLTLLPVAELARLGRARGIPLVVDNTLAPLIARPLDHGAAVVMHSATKWIGGHGNSMGGVLVEGGFDWEGAGLAQPLLNLPDPGARGVVWSRLARERGTGPLALRARSRGLAEFGACLAPLNAFLLLQGLETLALRMPLHCAQAERVAGFLPGQPGVGRVRYPRAGEAQAAGIEGGRGALVAFELSGGRDAARRFLDGIHMIRHVSNIGDCRTLVTHPASTTHAAVDEAALREAGIGPGFLRLSVGLEDAADIEADLARGLEAAEGMGRAA